MSLNSSLPATGLIGAGLLGSAVAQRWLDSGCGVVAFDVDSSKLDGITGALERARSAAEVFERCDRIALVLPHSGISAQVLNGIECRQPKIVLDMTTGDPEEMAAIAGRCATKGIVYLDATVGGSSAQVRGGQAIVMVGGQKTALDSCRGLLDAFAKRVFWLGAAGNGARMKLVLNLVLGLHRAVLAEGLAFAERCGLDSELALDVLRSGPAYSTIMDSKGRKMLRGDFTPQARLAQHRKDVDLILQEAARHQARTPFSELHRAMLVTLEDAGFAGEDNSAIIRAFREAIIPPSSETSEHPPQPLHR